MKKTVAHFIRKNTQLRSSFIQNQILNHIDYKPVIIFKYESNKNDGGFAEFNNNEIPVLNLWNERDVKSKLLYHYTKLITKEDVKKINEFLEKHKVHILHFHYGTDAGIYFPFLKKSSIPSVVSFYGYDAFSFPKRFWGYGRSYLNNRVFEPVTKIIAMTPEMKKDLLIIGCPKKKIIIHYHGVPSLLFQGITKSYHRENRYFTLLNISSFDPVKGHIFIFEALKQLISKGINNITLKIAGYGFFERELRRFVAKNKLEEFVFFLGPLKYGSKEMIDELQNADAFIHPSVVTKSDKEGIPGAVVEAMFAGLPVISTFHGGIPYVIENEKTGLLVKEWDIAALAEKIKMLIDNADLREKLGRSGQKFALENLDLHNKEQELEDIYYSLLS